jgi:hypothetical protein
VVSGLLLPLELAVGLATVLVLQVEAAVEAAEEDLGQCRRSKEQDRLIRSPQRAPIRRTRSRQKHLLALEAAVVVGGSFQSLVAKLLHLAVVRLVVVLVEVVCLVLVQGMMQRGRASLLDRKHHQTRRGRARARGRGRRRGRAKGRREAKTAKAAKAAKAARRERRGRAGVARMPKGAEAMLKGAEAPQLAEDAGEGEGEEEEVELAIGQRMQLLMVRATMATGAMVTEKGEEEGGG